MDPNTRKLFLLDAYALIYRSYYAFINNHRITTTGINTSATLGFCNYLLELLETEKPTHIAVVFDPEGKTFRHENYPAYKAHRPPMPEDLRKSVPYIKKIIADLGIPILSVPRYEADDVIGTLARKGEKEHYTVYMITPDKDYAQLVSEHVFMYKPPRSGGKSEVWGIPEVLDQFGIERVGQVVDILGLMGDSADNIPGCSGIGPKGAAGLVDKYGSIEGVYEHIDELKGKQKENLLACKDTVLLSKELATICTEVPLDISVSDLQRQPVREAELESVFRELELFSLMKRVLSIEGGAAPEEEELPSVIVRKVDISKREEIRKLVEILTGGDAFVMHPRFGKEKAFAAYPEALWFGNKASEVYVVALPSGAGETEEILPLFSPLFGNASSCWISDDNKRDLLWLKRAGISVHNRFFDVRIAHYLLQPDGSHELTRIALEYLRLRIRKTEEGKNASQLTLQFEEEEPQEESRHAEETDILWRLRSGLEEALGKGQLLRLYEEMEMPLVSVLAEMEYEGVSIDRDALKTMAGELKEKIAEIEKEIYRKAGREFNISSPKQLGEVLFDEMNIDPGNKKTKTGQASTSEQVLSKLEADHPIVGEILEYRGLKKLLTTYAEALPTNVDARTGKIHTRFNQAEAATGRLSSLNPNLQNIPIRTPEGRLIRKAFVTGDSEYCFFSADYSQVELRLMAHLSGDKGLIGAFLDDQDIHTATAAKIYHVALDEVTPEMRRRAKTANFGIIYGISAWGLAERLRISRKEGKELIEGYFSLYPGVKCYMEQSVERARKEGFVETLFGRRRFLRDINSRNAVVRGVAERNAVNAPLQGSAADIIKMAMIRIDKEIRTRKMQSRMILQVHDELNFMCHRSEKEALEKLVVDCMEHVITLSVPLSVSTGCGENWYEAH